MDSGYQERSTANNPNRVKPFTILMGMHNAAAAWIGIEHALFADGPNMTLSRPPARVIDVAIGRGLDAGVPAGNSSLRSPVDRRRRCRPDRLKHGRRCTTVATMNRR